MLSEVSGGKRKVGKVSGSLTVDEVLKLATSLRNYVQPQVTARPWARYTLYPNP
jgi:hypothetical protein